MRTSFRKWFQSTSAATNGRLDPSGGHVRGVVWLAATLFGMAMTATAAPPAHAQRKPATAETRPIPAHRAATERLAAVKSWAYQLQGANPGEIASSPYDLVVVDHTVNGDPDEPLKPADVERMKKKPGGGRRIVLAYVSIGEAEDYRFYWDQKWIETATPGESGSASPAQGTKPPPGAVNAAGPTSPAAPPKPDRWVSPTAPPWLGDESETWGGNFAVKYWDPAWQALIFGSPDAFVERVMALGFDGVYLDRVDAYYEHIDERPTAADDMVDFVIRLAAAARAARPGALIVPQNGEELLTRPAYVAAIDAVAKEDLLFGSPSEGVPNSQAQIANTLGWLSHARVAGRPVMVIEYVDDEAQIRAAQRDLVQRGFIPYFGPRSLDRLASRVLPPDAQKPVEARRK